MRNTTIWHPVQNDLGEGPLTHHLRGSLVWCDINECAVLERPFSDGQARRHDLPVMPSAAGIVDAAEILVATETDFRFLNLDTGATREHLPFPDEPDMRANDGRVHPSGAFWIGTMSKDGRSRPGALYRLFNGVLERMIDDVMIPNSTCFSADGRTAYYTDTPRRVIWAVPTDPDTGAITGERRVFAEVGDVPGGPDGSVTDADGQLWNARWGGAAVDVYDPDGRLVASHAVPARQPTCPAFVGVGLDRIVTTSARTGLASPTEADGAVIEIDAAVRGKVEPLVKP